MADTIQELYSSFAQQMEPIQAEDRYFRYLFEMAQASDTTLEQKREILKKKVDERWIAMVEDSLDAINTVIQNPRRFVTREEQLVPVELARKINGDSVRHLSQNTQFIQPSQDGDIHPSKILNVSTQETYDLYENRFIYHLIRRLLTFVDKRTDAIFWSTGNEIRNRLLMETTIQDAYETIEYKVEMSVKNRQSYAENDADNMDVFMRIDRLRRLVSTLRSSSFCQIMEGCAKVKSPIQRTNLIMKDPDYRKCYQLWQFMESYDEVGYLIEVEDTEMAIDDEYLIQMYTNLVNNYTVFKTLTEDERKFDEIEVTRHEVKAPVYVKEIVEEYVDDCNIPDVEIRQVFVDEVTRKQMELEAALVDETKAREAAEEDARAARHETVIIKSDLDETRRQYYAARDMAEKNERRASRAEANQEEAEDALKKAQQQIVEMRVSVEAAGAAQAAAESKAAQVAADAEAALAQAQAALETTRANCDAEVQGIRAEADQAIAGAKAYADSAVEATKKEAAAAITRAQQDNDVAMTEVKTAADLAVTAAEERITAQAAAAEAAAALSIAEAQEKASSTVAAAQAEAATGIKAAQEKAAAEIAAVKDETAATVKATQEKASAAVKAAQDKAAAAVKAAQDEAAATVKATEIAAAAAVKAAQDEAAATIAQTKADAEDAISKAQAAADAAVAAAQTKAEAAIAKAKQEATAAAAMAHKTATDEIAAAQAKADAAVSAAQQDAETLVMKANQRADKARKEANDAAQAARAEIDQAHSTSDAALAANAVKMDDERAAYAAELRKANADAADTLSSVRAAHAAELKQMQDEALRDRQAAEKQIDELKRQLAKAQRDLERAQKKAEGAGLFGFLSGKSKSEDDSEK